MDEAKANPYAPPLAPSATSQAENSVPVSRLASRARRFLGAMADSLILVVAIEVGAQVSRMLGLANANRAELAATAVLVVVGVQSHAVATSGQSLGKKLLRMRIERLDGAAPGFLHGVLIRSWLMAVLAAVPGTLCMMLFIFPLAGVGFIADALSIFGRDRRCLHDRLAGTRVIQLSAR